MESRFNPESLDRVSCKTFSLEPNFSNAAMPIGGLYGAPIMVPINRLEVAVTQLDNHANKYNINGSLILRLV